MTTWTKGMANNRISFYGKTELETRTGYIVTDIPELKGITFFVYRDFNNMCNECIEYSTGMRAGTGSNRKIALKNAVKNCLAYGTRKQLDKQLKRMCKQYGVVNEPI